MARFVIMGVSGCGKTSVGEALAAQSPVAFVDGDSLHPDSNIAKMASGQPLDDDDRAPWLADVGRTLAKHDGAIAIGCSALKRKYRDWIRAEAGDVHFLHLDAPKAVLAERVADRPGHFMPPSLLESQFEALERLEPDEAGRVIDISGPLSGVVAEAVDYVDGVKA